jgi:hypothetical protein
MFLGDHERRRGQAAHDQEGAPRTPQGPWPGAAEPDLDTPHRLGEQGNGAAAARAAGNHVSCQHVFFRLPLSNQGLATFPDACRSIAAAIASVEADRPNDLDDPGMMVVWGGAKHAINVRLDASTGRVKLLTSQPRLVARALRSPGAMFAVGWLPIKCRACGSDWQGQGRAFPNDRPQVALYNGYLKTVPLKKLLMWSVLLGTDRALLYAAHPDQRPQPRAGHQRPGVCARRLGHPHGVGPGGLHARRCAARRCCCCCCCCCCCRCCCRCCCCICAYLSRCRWARVPSSPWPPPPHGTGAGGRRP